MVRRLRYPPWRKVHNHEIQPALFDADANRSGAYGTQTGFAYLNRNCFMKTLIPAVKSCLASPQIRQRENAADRRNGLRQTLRFGVCGLAVLLCSIAATVRAQTLTQTISLRPGWNAVSLEVLPADPGVGSVFSNPAIASVWEPKVRVSTVAFIQNQNEAAFNRGGWAVYVPTNQPESINNDLFSVAANHSYLVKVSGAKNVTLNVTGTPSLRKMAFAPDAFTLRGFSVDPTSPPSFATFFGPSPAQHDPSGGLRQIYRLNNSSSQWALVGPTDLMARGVVYWVYSAGASSYMAPLSATPSLGDSLDFGLQSDEQDLTLENNTSNSMAVSITDLSSGARPLTYYYFSSTNGESPSWLPLPQVYSLTLGPGEVQSVRLGISRGQMTDDTYGTVLAVSDGNGTLLHVAVTAQRPAVASPSSLVHKTSGGAAIPVSLQAGLWVGDVSVNAVAETYNNITNTTPTRGSFDMRVIMHVTPDGTTRFLREVIEMFENGTYTNNAAGQQVLDQPGHEVLLTDDQRLSQYTGVALRDDTPVGRRISTAAFDFDPPGGTNFLTMTGSFGISNTVGCTITLTPDTPTNPFLHRYHPDHDNLDPNFEPLGTNVPPEVYTITRQIEMTFTPADPTGQTVMDYGYNEIGGIYHETLTGLHRNPLVTSGVFHLQRISDTPVLNADQ